MSRLVVDTNVVSFLFKNHPIAKLYDSKLLGHTLMLSFMTVAELDRWVIQRNWGEARRTWLNRYLEPFVILPYHRALCAKWAEVTVAAEARGYRIECADAWIASAALLRLTTWKGSISWPKSSLGRV
jgi:predicted nucleic acid-binding protein